MPLSAGRPAESGHLAHARADVRTLRPRAAALTGPDQLDCALADNGVMNVDDGVAGLAQMPTTWLLAAARVEVAEAGCDDPVPCLVALHERPTREVFEAAVQLLSSDDAVERELGVRILRELGCQDDVGRRPFTAQAVPLVVDRLRTQFRMSRRGDVCWWARTSTLMR